MLPASVLTACVLMHLFSLFNLHAYYVIAYAINVFAQLL